MNIFVTDNCPSTCARVLDDKRVIKMVLECAQMLSTAVGGPYRPTHVNHPCSKWVRQSSGNAYWLVKHMEALCTEYMLRYDKVHACESLLPKFQVAVFELPDVGLLPFVNCTSYKSESDVHLAYKLYLDDKWNTDKRAPTWYGRPY